MIRGVSVRTKVFFLFAGATLLTVVPVLVLIGEAVEDRVYERATQELLTGNEALRTYWMVQDEALQENARRIALERAVPVLIEEADTVRLRAVLTRLVSDRRVVMAADSTGATMVGPALDPEVLHGGTDQASIVTVPTGGGDPVRLAVWPVVTDSGTVGIVGVGTRLDSQMIRGLKDVTGGAEVALVVRDSVVATTLPDSLARLLSAMDLPMVIARGGIWRRQVETLPYLYSVNRLPTREAPTAVLLFRPVAQELRIARGINQSVLGIGAVALMLALVLALIIARIVARPAQALAAAASGLAEGRYDAPLPKPSRDEIGQLTRAFGEMRSAIAEREQRLRAAQAELIHREKLAAMGRLVAQLSHEINNPIYNIQNCLEVLDRRGDPDDPNREFLDLAREELQRMAVLTRQLLDQSRPMPGEAREIDLNQVVQRVVTLAGPRLESAGVQVAVELDAELPVVVAHGEAMHQVLANLVANAVDAMPAGGTLHVRTAARMDSVEITVVDSGVGIPDEQLGQIFEAFYTTKPGVRGVGLGLFVSEGIVRGHGGSLEVESVVGRGSRFVIRLPCSGLAGAAVPTGDGAAAPALA